MYLLAHKTADDLIWNMLKTKQDVLNKAGLFCEDLSDGTHSNAPITVSLKDFLLFCINILLKSPQKTLHNFFTPSVMKT